MSQKLTGFFDNGYTNSVKVWLKTEKACKLFLRIERTPPYSTAVSSSFEEIDNNILDTIHWKMLEKVIMCSFNVQGFHEEANEYIKKLRHFYCYCKEEHQYFVLSCTGHPFINRRMEGMQGKWNCKVLGPYRICPYEISEISD